MSKSPLPSYHFNSTIVRLKADRQRDKYAFGDMISIQLLYD